MSGHPSTSSGTATMTELRGPPGLFYAFTLVSCWSSSSCFHFQKLSSSQFCGKFKNSTHFVEFNFKNLIKSFFQFVGRFICSLRYKSIRIRLYTQFDWDDQSLDIEILFDLGFIGWIAICFRINLLLLFVEKLIMQVCYMESYSFKKNWPTDLRMAMPLTLAGSVTYNIRYNLAIVKFFTLR